MKSLSTLSSVADRFTTTEQFDKYAAYLEDQKINLGSAYDSLLKSLNDYRKNLVWDEKYMKEFIAHLTELKNQTASASAMVVSVMISIVSVAVLYFLN